MYTSYVLYNNVVPPGNTTPSVCEKVLAYLMQLCCILHSRVLHIRWKGVPLRITLRIRMYSIVHYPYQ